MKINNPPNVFQENIKIFEALSDKNRQFIMVTLAKGVAANSPLTVHELANLTELSRPTISHHLKVLKEADLLVTKKIGTKMYYEPKFETPLKMAHQIIKELTKD